MTDMKQIKIEKLTFNIGAGKDQALLEKAMKLLKNITGIEPIKTITQKRVPAWGVRPGLPVGTKITIRNKAKIKDLLTRCLKAKENKLKKSCFDSNGNVAFGIAEYIDVPGLEYDPDIGIIGFQLNITLARPGFSKMPFSKIGKDHKIKQSDSIKFMKDNYEVEVEE